MADSPPFLPINPARVAQPLARIRLSALPPAASGVAGFSLGAIAMLALPGALANAAGLLAAGAGLAGVGVLMRCRAESEREQLLAGLGELKVRLATNAIRIDSMAQRFEELPMREADAAPARAILHELTAEVGLLGDLMHQIATTLDTHDDQISVLQGRLAKAAPPPPQRAPEPVAAVAAPSPLPDRLVAEHAAAVQARQVRAAEERAAVIGEALSRGQVEIHLQPIVRLPQRRTIGYEALVRLRLDDKTLLLPAEFQGTVEERGFGPTLDALVLTRSLAIARHLGRKDGNLFVSCNFTSATWGSSRALATLSRILERYHEHVGNLVIELPQRVFRTLEPTSLGLLGAMSASGVRFALDQVQDLRFDPAALQDRGVRFVKVSCGLLLAEPGLDTLSDIAARDLAAHLARGSVQLVADEVETDPMVADMLDLGISYGQGVVFSPPRPVKPEVFAEPQEERAASAEPAPPAKAAPTPAPAAEVVPYPTAAPAPASSSEARVSFRSVLRRASA